MASLLRLGLFVIPMALQAGEARADLVPGPPPPCSDGHRGDACEGAGSERGECQPVKCDAQSPYWRNAKGATECLACVVPPDPPVNDPPAVASAPAPKVPVAAPAPPPSRVPGRVLAIGTGLLLVGGLLALLRRQRRQGP